MISLKRNIEEHNLKQEIQSQTEVLHEAIRSYLSAMEGIRRHAFRACPPLLDQFRESMLALMNAITPVMQAPQWQASRKALEDELTRFGDQAAEDYEAMASDLREIVELATSATDTLATTGKSGRGEFLRFTTQVESLTRIDNIAELRKKLRQEVQHMHSCLEKMAHDDSLMIQKLQRDLVTARQRLVSAEKMSCRDPLTGLANLMGFEQAATTRANAGSAFCILLLNITRFHAINERFGQTGGDQVLVEFGKRLQATVRDADTVCRTAADEFVVIIDCYLQDALRRATQLNRSVAGAYPVNLETQAGVVEINLSVAAAEFRRGEAAAQLLERARSILTAVC